MQAIVAKSGSDAQDAGAFKLTEQPMPEPGTQDLLVRVIAIGSMEASIRALEFSKAKIHGRP